MTLWFFVEYDFGGLLLASEEKWDENQGMMFNHMGHVFPRILQNVGFLQINFTPPIMNVSPVQYLFRYSLDLSHINRLP